MPVAYRNGTDMIIKIVPIRPPMFGGPTNPILLLLSPAKCCHRLSTQPHLISTKKPDLDPEGPGFSQPGGLIAAASEVISCERSPTSAADNDSTRDRIECSNRGTFIRHLEINSYDDSTRPI